MAKLFDTHSHYTDEYFEARKDLIPEIFAGDVGHIITVAVDATDSEKCVQLASQYENMFASVGIHPSEITEITDIPAEIAKLERHIAHSKCVALGEMGLDYHWAKEHAAEQKKLFERQMELAVETGLPVIIHDREAHGDTFDIIKRYEGKVRGVMHCYSGHAELACEYVKMGWYVSFTGVITYKNAQKNVEAAKAVPLDRFLIETDCPYLTPVPMRSKKNHSGFLHYTAECAANILGVDYDTFVEATTANAKKLFCIE